MSEHIYGFWLMIIFPALGILIAHNLREGFKARRARQILERGEGEQ